MRPQIVLFGDSNTECACTIDGGWAAGLIKTYSRKADVMVRGYSDYDTGSALFLLDHIFPLGSSKPPVATIVFFGAIDATISGVEYKKNLTEIVSHLKKCSSNMVVLLITPLPLPPVNDRKRKGILLDVENLHPCAQRGRTSGRSSPNLTNQIQNSEQQDRATCTAYIKAVKDKFQDNKDKFYEFLELFQDLKAERTDLTSVITRLNDLFKGHRDLIVGLNTILHEVYKINLDKDVQPQWRGKSSRSPQKPQRGGGLQHGLSAMELADTYAQQCIDLAQELGLPTVACIDLWNEMQQIENWQNKFLSDDGLHLTRGGNHYVCNAVSTVLSEHGLCPSQMPNDFLLLAVIDDKDPKNSVQQ